MKEHFCLNEQLFLKMDTLVQLWYSETSEAYFSPEMRWANRKIVEKKVFWLPFRRRSGPRFHWSPSEMLPFEIRSGPRCRYVSSEMLPFQKRSGPRFHCFSSEMLSFEIRSWPQCRYVSSEMPPSKEVGLDFTVFRRKCFLFKKEVSLDFTICRRRCFLLK